MSRNYFETLDIAITRGRTFSDAAAILGLVALALASLGLYAVIANDVAHRRRKPTIGV